MSTIDYFNALTCHRQQLDMLEDISGIVQMTANSINKFRRRSGYTSFFWAWTRSLTKFLARFLVSNPCQVSEKSSQKLGERKAEERYQTLAARGSLPSSSNQQKRRNNKPWCEHCRRTGHAKETCWKLHGKPKNWKPWFLQERESKGTLAARELLLQGKVKHLLNPVPSTKNKWKCCRNFFKIPCKALLMWLVQQL